MEQFETWRVSLLHGREGEGWNSSSYAFKPKVISHAVSKYGCVLWLDSSFEVHSPLACLFDHIMRYGLLLSINSWLFPSAYAHHETLARFNVWHPAQQQSEKTQGFRVPRLGTQLPMEIQSGIVGVSSLHDNVVKLIIKPWLDCANLAECIAPNGSDKSNHRQDQTVLNAILVSLAYKADDASTPSSSAAAAAALAAAVPVSGKIFSHVDSKHDSTCDVQCFKMHPAADADDAAADAAAAAASAAAGYKALRCRGGCAGYQRHESVSGCFSVTYDV